MRDCSNFTRPRRSIIFGKTEVISTTRYPHSFTYDFGHFQTAKLRYSKWEQSQSSGPADYKGVSKYSKHILTHFMIQTPAPGVPKGSNIETNRAYPEISASQLLHIS